MDFDGCFALVFGRCECGFCGWCLANCVHDAHDHVRRGSKKPPGADTYFGLQQRFEEADRRRKKELVHTSLDGIAHADFKAKVEAACMVELQANTLWPVDA